MNLLNEAMRRPLDPGYGRATELRHAAGDPRVPPWRRAWMLVLAVALGLLTAAAAVDLRAPEPAVAQARALLERQIGERTATADRTQAANAQLSREIEALQIEALGEQRPELVAQLAADGVSSGALPVTGPGLRITVQDSDTARENLDESDPDERVQDVDLQIVVNGLWSAGAEAVAVNGHRLTAVTAIRSAGSAILVDLVPLSGPYVVEAIGDPARLATAFARTSAGQHLSTLSNTYGISNEIAGAELLELPGAGRTRLLSASAVGSSAVATPGGRSPSDVASSPPTDERDTP